jgi:pimeloyl-ACP methyl ester carboxylesterase
MSKKTLYALVVAIDNYPIAGHKLNGCVNDATEFSNYLRDFCASAGIAFSEKRLFDAAAKRLDIVQGFEHFDAAQNGDTCVYYYSGHGSQMKAHPSFWDEPDGLSETIVCYDSRLGQAGCRDMADKEVGYLIHKATKDKDVHFLAVTDCCHSGSNTRDIEVRARMAETCPTAPKGVEEYVGFAEWNNFQPPAADHVHLAAAKDDETAKELRINGIPRGVFTYSLIETLKQTAGNISYTELTSRLQIKAKGKVQDQTPLCSFYGGKISSLQQLSFLGETQVRPDFFPVQYDGTYGWIVKAGGVQGVPTEGGVFELDNGIKVNTTAVFGNYSTLSGMNLLSQTELFRAKLVSAAPKTLRLAFANDSDTEGGIWIKKIMSEQDFSPVQLVENPQDADYLIRAWDGAYRLTQKDDTKPLFRRVADYNQFSAQSFLSRCQSVGTWRNLLEIANPNTRLSDNAVKIVFRDVTGTILEKPIFRQTEEGKSVRIQVGVTNLQTQPLYVSAVYFGADFGITNEYFRGKQIKLNETAWAEYKNEQSLPFRVQKEYRSWGVNEIEEYFKIFVSTDPLSTDGLYQEGLPLDERGAAKRGVGDDDDERGIDMSQDWRTFDRAFRIVCPLTATNLDTHTTANIGNIRISAPSGFSAKVSLSSTQEAKRAIDSDGKTGFATQKFSNQLASAALSEGMSSAPPLDVLEVEDFTGDISAENPLRLHLPSVNSNETIIPVGFDAASGLYLPVGSQTTEGGDIDIIALPSDTATTRSLKKSSKIFFKKMVGKLTGDYEYPLLRYVKFGNSVEDIEYINDMDYIKKQVADPSVQRIVLFIHGWIGSTSDKPCALKRQSNERGVSLDGSYDLVLAFDYESMNTLIDENSQMLKDKLEAVGLKAGHGKQFDIIAHSMGGLVSRWYIERLGGKNVVSHLVMLGTPNAGSEIADLKAGLITCLTMALNGWAVLQPYVLPLTWLGRGVNLMMKTIEQQQPKGQFIQNLNASPDANVPYHIVVGNTKRLQQNSGTYNGFFSKVYHALKDRGVYGISDAYFGEPNDMIVRAKSIGSAGQQNKVKVTEVAADHFTYFLPLSEGLSALNMAVRETVEEVTV